MPRVRSLKSRSLYVLYGLLYESIKERESVGSLCSAIVNLGQQDLITMYEEMVLQKHFQNQKPTAKLHKEFFNNKRFTGQNYWWDKYEEYNPVNRKLFILYLRDRNKPWWLRIYHNFKY